MTLYTGLEKWFAVFRVDQSEIEANRAKGWADFHPEEFCHRCGNRNLQSWFVDSPEWNLAVRVYEDGHHVGSIDGYPGSEIICPQCFVEAWEKATGVSVTWELRLSPPTDHRGEEKT